MGNRMVGLIVLALLGLTACKDLHKSVDYERHKYSGLRTSMSNSDVVVFEAMTTAEAPGDTEAGEAIRMEWLEGWLAQRKMCQSGYEILERRGYTRNDANPYGYDLRYEVRCATPPENSAN